MVNQPLQVMQRLRVRQAFEQVDSYSNKPEDQVVASVPGVVAQKTRDFVVEFLKETTTDVNSKTSG